MSANCEMSMAVPPCNRLDVGIKVHDVSQASAVTLPLNSSVDSSLICLKDKPSLPPKRRHVNQGIQPTQLAELIYKWCTIKSCVRALSISACIYLSIHLSIYLSIYLCVYICLYLSIYLSIDLSIYVSIYRSVDLSIYRSIGIDLSVYRSSIYRSIDLSIYLSNYCIHPSIQSNSIQSNPIQSNPIQSIHLWWLI